MDKVFCIGLPKTGTTSIGKAFELLGYRHNARTESLIGVRDVFSPNPTYLEDQLDNYDAFEDTPWHLIYDIMASAYPEAKFILTERSSSKHYIDSLSKESDGKKLSDLHIFKKMICFGVPEVKGNEGVIRNEYHNHNDRVREFFKYMPERLLVFETGKHGWLELCEFLEKDVPPVPYPWLNKSK